MNGPGPTDGRFLEEGWTTGMRLLWGEEVMYMVDPDDHAYSPGCHCQECLTERQAMP